MERTLVTMGLLTLISCGGVDNDEAVSQPPATEAAQVSAGAAAGADEATVAPLRDHFTVLPPGRLPTSVVQPRLWASEDREEALPGEVGALRGHFDPAMMNAIEQYRLTTGLKEGAR